MSTALQFNNTISPFDEMAAYEQLWAWKRGSLKAIAELFKAHPYIPTKIAEILRDELSRDLTNELLRDIRTFLNDKRRLCKGITVCLNGDFVYPSRLRDAKYPVELFYYRGDINFTQTRCVSVVGARKASEEGVRRAARMAKYLVDNDFTVVSGIAAGIDTSAMKAAISAGGRVIGVIGTPINESYPKDNQQLQHEIGSNHLLMSQVPFFHYTREPFAFKKRYFPERNETMSALSEATIIVEASETSGTLTQARACMSQGRKLFILNSCFENPKLTWPRKFEQQGAIRVKEFHDILKILGFAANGS